jgi:ADP-heptose:LPS heptosyltransferase
VIQPSCGTSDATALYDATRRLEEFRELRSRGTLERTSTERLATEAASAFFTRFEKRGEYLADAVTLLAEISALDDPSLAEPGCRATFPLLIERLSDSFDPRLCPLYDRAFAQMISICRRLPSGENLDAALQRFGMGSEAAMIERKSRLLSRPPMLDTKAQARVNKVIVLSRVTLGADVAVTSIVLQKARRIFPQAELVVAGSQKLAQLFGGDKRVRIRPLRYRSEGGLIERLSSWPPLIEAIDDETCGLLPGEWVVIDPDSRLLQLGLLPAVANDEGYFFLESRAFGKPGDGNLSRITLRWLDEMFGGAAQSECDILPTVYLKDDDIAWGRAVSSSLRRRGSRCLVAASFGVGGNQEKRLPDPFEERLLSRLIDEGCTLILDSGFGDEEAARAKHLAERLRSRGCAVFELDARNSGEFVEKNRAPCHMITWRGEIGPFAALIAASDEYLGYDSSGQHIAAALGVPAIDIFAGNTTPIFRERWTPSGRAPVEVIAPSDPDAALEEVIARHKAIETDSRAKS